MNSVDDNPSRAFFAANHSYKPVHFYLDVPNAKSVQVVGDFTLWTPVPMHQRVDGWWYVQILLIHGHHKYRFLVDGRPILDPRASGTTRDDRNQPVSLVAVS